MRKSWDITFCDLYKAREPSKQGQVQKKKQTLAVQKLDVQQKRVLYKLHAGWFINRTPWEFINWGIFIKFKGFLCRNLTERGESLILNSGRQAVYKSNPGTVIVCRKRGASGQEKIQYIK